MRSLDDFTQHIMVDQVIKPLEKTGPYRILILIQHFFQADVGEPAILFRLIGQVILDNIMDSFKVCMVEVLEFKDNGYHLVEATASKGTTVFVKLINLRLCRMLLRVVLEW